MAMIAVFLPAAALIAAGGPDAVIATLSAAEPETYLSWTGGRPDFLFLGFAFGIASIGLGTFGQPHLIARLMAVKDDAARKRGFAIAMGWAVIIYAGMATLALSGRALLGAGQEGEAMFYTLAGELFPPLLAGLVIAAVLSAVMSTVDSLLVATSAAVAHDMGVAKAMPGREVLISRIVMTVLCVLAVVLAMTLPASIFSRVLFSWSALGAAFGPILFARVAGVEPKPAAILAAITLGFFTTVFFYIYGQIGGDSLPARLAALPGDPFERIFPWVVPLILVFGWRQSRRTGSSPAS
jgi:sodium/proline symporter